MDRHKHGYRKRYYQEHPEKRDARNQWMKEYRKKNPEKYKNAYKKAARKNKRKIFVWNLRRKYGISEREYNVLLESQNHLCAICKTLDLNKQLCVDHDHQNGKIRGLLCYKCNYAIGLMKDDVKIVKSALFYLEKRWLL